MKAQPGDRIELTKRVLYGSVYKLIDLPVGTRLTVAERMSSDDYIRTVESFPYEGHFGDKDVHYFVWDSSYRIVQDYVSFDEVIRQITLGRSATFHHANGKKTTIGARGSMDWAKQFSWLTLINGKWTIEPCEHNWAITGQEVNIYTSRCLICGDTKTKEY